MTECDSWYMMADLRNIMSGIFSKAQEWGDIARHIRQPDAAGETAPEMEKYGRSASSMRTNRPACWIGLKIHND